MKEKKRQLYLETIRRHNGILRYSDAISLGIPRYVLETLLSNGDLVREARGLYRISEPEPFSNLDLSRVSILVPRSVVCLLSALFFHELTTQIPGRIHIALPRGVKNPKIQYPPIRVFRFSEKPFSSGIEEHDIGGIRVRIYSKEKTIADCFKFRRQIGTGIAVEALRDYMTQSTSNIRSLSSSARVDRVEHIMRPYLETFS